VRDGFFLSLQYDTKYLQRIFTMDEAILLQKIMYWEVHYC